MGRVTRAGAPGFVAVVAVLLSFSAASVAQAPDFRFGVTAPDRVDGEAGFTAVFPVEVTLSSSTPDHSITEGAQGWSFSLVVGGGAVKSISLKGVSVSTLF